MSALQKLHLSKLALRAALALGLVLPLSGCGKEPTAVSISATTHNYSQDYVVELRVGDKSAGSLAKPAAPGKVTGGGVVCCIQLELDKKNAEVEMQFANSKGIVSTITVQARIRRPWPEIASYAVFNVLPGQRVLVEVVPTYLIPSGDRLEELERTWRETQ